MQTNTEALSGYGNDPYTSSAKEKIRAACDCPGAQVHLLTGGTQTNRIVIEASGHKVLQLPGRDGKLLQNVFCFLEKA